MARIIFFLIDGFSDPPSLKTPLRLSKKPFLNSILNNIFLANFLPLEKPFWPKQGNRSVTGLANLGILGYKIKPEKLKRGPLEAYGADIKLKKNEIALRVDFGSVDNNLIVIDRRAGRNTFGFEILEKDINQQNFDINFHFYRTYGHRGVLIFKGKLSDKISDSDPYEKNRKVKKIRALDKNYLSKKTARLVWSFLIQIYNFLKNHEINKERIKRGLLPANFLLTRETGKSLPKLKNFFKDKNIKNGLVIAENGVVKGGCKLVGFNCLTLPEIENIEKRYEFYKNGIENNFNKYDLIYIHLKEADEASHDKNFEKKLKFFEFFDKWFEKIYLKFKETIFVITGDHLTDVKSGKHQWGFLPIIIINSKFKNKPKEISEIEAQKSGILIKPKKLWNFYLK